MHAFRRALPVLACLFCLASSHAVEPATGAIHLTKDMPDRMADDFTARTLAMATQSGWKDAGTLGTPWMLVRDKHILGVLVSGRYEDQRAGGSNMTCFLAYFRSATDKGSLLPTVGQGRLAAETCSGYTALGLLPANLDTVRLGILYDAALADKSVYEPVILSWKIGDAPVIDSAASARCSEAEAATIADMRKANCGTKALPWATPAGSPPPPTAAPVR